MSIEKRRDGYCVRWRDSTGTPRSKQVRLYRDAISLDGEKKRQKAMGELITHERGSITLVDFWEVWRRDYGATHLTAKTIEAYERQWRKHVLTALKPRLQVKAITREKVDAAIAKWSTTLKPASVRKVIAVLQSVLSRAADWGYIASNPVTRAKKPRIAGEQRRGRPFQAAELDPLLKELDTRSQIIVRVLWHTGLRPSELRRLTWEDLGAAGISVWKSKTHKSRVVEWRPAAQPVLKEWFMAQGQPAPDALVFPSVQRRGAAWSDNAWRLWQQKVFGPACCRAGLKGHVAYDLRHTFVTTLIKEGKDVIYVANQAGHSPEVCLSIYSHEFKSVYSECTANLPWAANL